MCNDNYESLANSLEQIKHKKNNLEGNLKEKKLEKSNISDELNSEYYLLLKMKDERDNIINRSNSLFNNMAGVLLILITVLFVVLGINIYSSMSPIGIVKSIFAILGLSSAIGSAYFLSFIFIIYSNNLIKEKMRNKARKQARYLELSNKISATNEKITGIKFNLDKIVSEIEKIVDQIKECEELISSKKEELEKLDFSIESITSSYNADLSMENGRSRVRKKD